jgi:glycine/D-amino acid oxidase-like deaminating enzyme
MADDIFAPDFRIKPYWWEAAPRPTEEPSSIPKDADVAIVGSGYTGLSAALTLARAGRKVVVFEAGEPGYGASSRNGGMVGPAFHHGGATEVIERYGRERGIGVLQEGLNAVAYLKGLIERERIDARFQPVGRFCGALRPHQYDSIAREMEALKSLVDFQADMVPRGEQPNHIGSDFYHGGMITHQDGGLHPGLYHLGLLERAKQAGVTVLAKTPVTGLVRERQRVAIATPRGEVSAGAALVATNGYTGRVTPQFRKRLVPLRSSIIATEPIAPALMDKLMPKRHMLVDRRRITCYYRPSPDHTRVLFGGRTVHDGDETGTGTERRNARFLHDRMTEIFPELRDTKITHYWSGYVAFTFDHRPHLGEIDGIHYAMGYCGSGVTRSTYFGHKIAQQIMGLPEGKTAYDGLAFQTRPLYNGNPWFLPAVIAWYRVADRMAW